MEPRLQLEHYMPADRLRWNYLRRLMRGIGESNVCLDSYFYVPEGDQAGPIDRIRKRYWWWQFVSEFRRLLKRYPARTLIKCYFAEMYDDDAAPDIEWRVGRLTGLIRLRSRYITLRHEISNASWRRRESPFWDLNASSAK